MLKEACVETFDEALAAERNGADRIELCSRLDLGGLTPSKYLTRRLLKSLKIPIKVMIRAREGNFCYNSKEINQMLEDIIYFNSLGVFGVVLGVLKSNSNIDIPVVNFLTKSTMDLHFTFHKAIDDTNDIISQLKILMKDSHVSSVLSSGGSLDALSGSTILRDMIKTAKDDISIICAGSITYENFSNVHDVINGQEYHGKNIINLSK